MRSVQDEPRAEVVRLSAIDSERFGITVARAEDLSAENVQEILGWCETEHVDLVIARCPADDVAAIQAMGQAGFFFTGGDIHYRGALHSIALAQSVSAHVRILRPEERTDVAELAAAAFSRFMGHYHANPRLPRDQCDAAYRSWADRCCSGEAADVVVVAELWGQVAGFSAFRAVSGTEGQLVLGAVADWARGHGLYGQMTLAGAAWCRGRGLRTLLAITQLGNLPAQRTWANLGMKPVAAAYTFHRWWGTSKE